MLVDEYQDTNTSQYEMVRLLVGERASRSRDDDRPFAWQAKPQNLVLLKEHFPNLRLIMLSKTIVLPGASCIAPIYYPKQPHEFEKTVFRIGLRRVVESIAMQNEEHEVDASLRS